MHVDNKVFDNISFVSFHHRYVKPNIRTVLNNNHSQELVRFLGTASFHLKCFFFNLFSFFRFIFFNFLNPRRACVAACGQNVSSFFLLLFGRRNFEETRLQFAGHNIDHFSSQHIINIGKHKNVETVLGQ
jgi:hypothetical protein